MLQRHVKGVCVLLLRCTSARLYPTAPPRGDLFPGHQGALWCHSNSFLPREGAVTLTSHCYLYASNDRQYHCIIALSVSQFTGPNSRRWCFSWVWILFMHTLYTVAKRQNRQLSTAIYIIAVGGYSTRKRLPQSKPSLIPLAKGSLFPKIYGSSCYLEFISVMVWQWDGRKDPWIYEREIYFFFHWP